MESKIVIIEENRGLALARTVPNFLISLFLFLYHQNY